MTQTTLSGTSVERLTKHLFDQATADPAAAELATWLAGWARFRAFAEAHRDKIRKKLRGAADAEARLDVRAELRVAHLMLADKRFDLKFEAYGSAKVGPDFTVTYRDGLSFNLEVTRLRRPPVAGGAGGQLLAKLRQLPASVPNALLIAIEGGSAEAFDVAATTRALRARADGKDEEFFTGRGFEGSQGFYERYLRLGAVLVWCEGAMGEARAALWTNRSARIAFPERAGRACLSCLRAG